MPNVPLLVDIVTPLVTIVFIIVASFFATHVQPRWKYWMAANIGLMWCGIIVWHLGHLHIAAVYFIISSVSGWTQNVLSLFGFGRIPTK
jgi:hypothetical protein